MGQEIPKGPAIQPAGAQWPLNGRTYSSGTRFVESDRPLATAVQRVRHDGLDCLRLTGNGSAGVDIDSFNADNDTLVVEMAIKVEQALVGDQLRLLSIGDEGHVLLALKKGTPDSVQVRVAGRWHKVGCFPANQWTRTAIRVNQEIVTVTLDDHAPVDLPAFGISQRVYLGDGYPEAYIAPEDGFLLDLDRLKTRVVETPGRTGLRKLTHE